jgi:AcrR family transcriptional regulator
VGRGKARDGRARATLVEVAVANFAALGYHGTTMRDIARDAGVTVASIYHHFPAKQDLLQEIMIDTMRSVLACSREALLDSDSAPAAQLDAIVRTWIEYHTGHQREALIGSSELRSLDESGRRIVVALRDEQEALFRGIIERGCRLDEFRTEFPREAARAVISMGYSIASWYRPGGELSPDEMAVRYCELARAIVRK